MTFTTPIPFMKQPMMRKVLYALIPLILASVYFFGWRSLLVIAVSCAAGVFAEWLFKRSGKKPVTEAVFVSAVLYSLTLPPAVPLWIAALGIIFGIIFGKEVFGGFGRNVFNPALVGRAFVYVCFPAAMTTEWSQNLSGGLGGFLHYAAPLADVSTSATPLLFFKNTQTYSSIIDLILGTTGGALGETSALLMLLGGAYLVFTKTADWKIIAATLCGFLSASYLFFFLGSATTPQPLWGLFSGGLLFGAVFMATDPISAPKTKEARWAYGLLIGVITVIIRSFSLFSGGVMFAILIANTFAPLLDEIVKALKAKPSAQAASASPTKPTPKGGDQLG